VKPTPPLPEVSRLRNQVDCLVAVILDGYEPHLVLREYADDLGAKDRREVFRKAATKGIDLRTAKERRLVRFSSRKTLP
jgi:hypothetical protein